MFGSQPFVEVYASLKAHKTRAAFTGFGVIWAVFISALLQGGSSGFYNGMVKKFHIYTSQTMLISCSSAGSIGLTEDVADNLACNLNVFDQVMPVFQHSCSVSYEQEIHEACITGVRMGYEKIKNLGLEIGRFFTERDLAQKIPVCILGTRTKMQIFGKGVAVGKFILIDGVAVVVIGVLEATGSIDDVGVVILNTFFKELFPKQTEAVSHICCTLRPKQNSIKVIEKVRAYLLRQLALSDEDCHLLYIRVPSITNSLFQLLFRVISLFIWLISLCFLVSGIVNIGNMMLVVVKERTQELAIRKVLGARSKDIMALILLESVIIHFIAGILGMGIGVGTIQWINLYLLPVFEKYGITYFEFQFSSAIITLVVLVLSGCVAGIIPAKKAMHIKPVDALNNQ